MKTLIIAEIGNNHNASLERAFKLVEEAKKAGAHIAKFQLRNLSNLYRGSDVEDLGVEYTKDLLNKYNLDISAHKKIKNHCDAIGIEYMCTPWDCASVFQLENLGVKRYKVASADLDNFELLSLIAATKKPLYLSTGMHTLSGIKKTYAFLKEAGVEFSLLHCNSTYPAPFADIELNFINTLKSLDVDIGYSGHERGIAISVAAVALGAVIIERHITLDKTLEGPDHQASLLPKEFSEMVNMIQEVELALGDRLINDRHISQGVALNREILGKSLVAAKTIDIGEKIYKSSLEVKAPGQGMSPSEISKILGKTIRVKKRKGDFIFQEDFKEKNTTLRADNLGSHWGIPVRPHDVIDLHTKFDAPVYEFHISYQDLIRRKFPKELKKLKHKKVLVHAPELFSDSMLLNLCTNDKVEKNQSVRNLQDVFDYSAELKKKIGTDQKIQVIANVGGFSIHGFMSSYQRLIQYNNLVKSLRDLDFCGCDLLPQNMAPFPWHLGGQRYQNIFMKPIETLEFCIEHGLRICLDTAHLYMYCNYSDSSFLEAFDLLSPVTAHIHMSDAIGNNGEGVKLGQGGVNFEHILSSLREDQSYIVETWQGHKNNGEGFRSEINFLNGVLN